MAAAAAPVDISVQLPDAGDLCTLSITDAHHDFKILSRGEPGSDPIKNMMPAVPGGCLDTITDEDNLAVALVGLGRFKELSHSPFTAIIPSTGGDRSGNLKYEPPDKKVDGAESRNPYLSNYDIYQANNNSNLVTAFTKIPGDIYFVVDTKGGGFSTIFNTIRSTINFYYVQNRQTLYDPADKITPITPSGKVMFKDDKIKFVFEDTTPGMTQNYTYPIFGANTDINESIFCKNLMVQTLKSSDPTNYKSQKSTVFMKDEVTNNVYIFNKEIAQKSTGSLLGKIQQLFKNNTSDEIKAIFGDKIVIKDITNEHHYVAKRLGDQGQALSTCQPKMKLMLEDSRKIESNGNHCFVTYDRPAMVAAIMYGAPMVLYNYTSSDGGRTYPYTLFVNKKLNTPELRLRNLQERYNTMIKKHENDVNIQSINQAEVQYKEKYVNITTLLDIQNRNNFSNTRDKNTYINFLKGYLLPARYIQLLSSIDVGSYERARSNLIRNENTLTEGEIRTVGAITVGLNNKIQIMEKYINDIIQFEKIKEINEKFLKAIPGAGADNSIDLSVKNDVVLKEFLPQVKLADIAVADAPRAMRGLESKVDVFVGTKILIYILIQLRSFEVYYATVKGKIQTEIMENLHGEPTNVETFKKKFMEIFDYVENLDSPALLSYDRIIEQINNIQEQTEVIISELGSDATSGDIERNIDRLLTPIANELITNVLAERGPGTSLLYPLIEGGGNPEYTLEDYYDDDRYLRSVLILYAAIRQNKFPVKYLGFPKTSKPEIELYNSLVETPISVLSYLFGFTVDEITTKKPVNSKKDDFYKNKSICYYDFIEFQISPYPELQAIYILLNKEYYDEKYRIPIPIPYKFLEHIRMRQYRMMKYEFDQSKHFKSFSYINIAWYNSYKTLRRLLRVNPHDATFGKTNIPQYGIHGRSVMHIPQNGIMVSTKGGGRRYRKTKRKNRNQKPSKKYTRRYKNPQKKSKTRTRTRK